MYTERPLQICTENATALRWLGDYFEVTQLRWDARQFILKNISVDNVGIYYQHSAQLHEECVLKAVQTFTGKHILDIQLDNQIVLSAAPTFWADVLALNVSNPVSKTLSLHVSRIVATTASLHSEELSRETFNSLTGESVIPQVSSCVALSLCKVDDLLKLNEPEENNGTNLDSVSLQTRCADALAETWRNFAVKDNVESLVSRQPTFLVNLLLQSLEDAREKEANFQRSLNDANQTISSLQDDLNEAAAAARRSDSRWRQKLHDAKSRASDAESVISRFNFVPTSYYGQQIRLETCDYPPELAKYGKKTPDRIRNSYHPYQMGNTLTFQDSVKLSPFPVYFFD